jgi:ferredoxin
MIVAEIKPFEEIKSMLKGRKKILVLGCGTCVTVCMSGGEKQVGLLASALRMSKKIEGEEGSIGEKTVLRQCDPEFIDQIREDAGKHDVILSMACGAGVQGVAGWLKDIEVLPAMNTRFIGISEGQGSWVEACAACGDCILASTGGICPVTTCPKGILNGPCGGNKKGKCEVSPDIPCAWIKIYDRMKELGRLADLKKEAGAKDWSKGRRPGRFSVRESEEASKP